jgi:hypothetical protein
MFGLAAAGPIGVAGAETLPDVSAHPPWTLTRRIDDPEGYTLYRRDLPDSDFAAFRLEATIEAPAGAVAAAFRKNITDPKASPKNMKKTVIREDGNVVVLYSYIEIPLMSDRDVTTRGVRSFDPETGSHRFHWKATDEGPAPKEGVVRLEKSTGSWVFTPLAEGRTSAVYEGHTDIEGAIPSWLVDRLAINTVVDGLVILRARVERDRKRMAVESSERSSRAQ